jgi:phosphomannomutase
MEYLQRGCDSGLRFFAVAANGVRSRLCKAPGTIISTPKVGDFKLPDQMNLSMFRAYDIRTPAKSLSDELAERLAAAEAVYFRDTLGVSGVVVTHDARRTGPRYLALAAEAYRRAGLDVVYLPGPSSTCYLYYAAMRNPEHAAVMFGASHNPAGDTGQKILGPQVTPIAADIGPEGGLHKIQSLYVNADRVEATRFGRILVADYLDDFVEYSLRLAGVDEGELRGTRLMHDYLFGAASHEMMRGFARAGADLTPLHFVPDGGFPLGDPNPVKQDVIRHGQASLYSGDFLFGCFFDGDGDRIDFYRGDGTYLSSSFIYAAILPEIRQRYSGDGLAVFADLKANPRAVIEMAKTGVAVDVIRNGHSQIKQSLIEDMTHFGAVEESAHFYESFSLGGPERFCTENTLYLALLAARAWHSDPARFAQLIELQETTAREREWGYKFPSDGQRDEALQAVREYFETQGAAAQTRMKNGMDLEATLLRRGLPFEVNQDTQLAADWLQICQRVSQSEDRLARWDAVGATPQLVQQAKRDIAERVAAFGAGEEYQG